MQFLNLTQNQRKLNGKNSKNLILEKTMKVNSLTEIGLRKFKKRDGLKREPSLINYDDNKLDAVPEKESTHKK